MTKETQYSVLIAGAGPVGLTLAIELGLRGIGCLLIERRDGGVKLPKMSGVTSRGMEICRRWGISKQVRAAGIPEDHNGDIVYFSDLVGPELARWIIPPPSDTRRLTYTPEPPCKCAQIFFDPILAGFAKSLPSIEVRYSTTLSAFEQSASGVTAHLVAGDGRAETIEVDYLAGCDGPASTVRSGLGVELEGLGVMACSTSIFFRSRALASLHHKGWAHVYRSIDEKGCWSEMIPIDGKELWRLTLFDDGDLKDTPERSVRRFVGVDFPFEIINVTPWERRDYLARSYGSSRVFIAGDSCHECSPTGGLGMHTGIEEALNLGWKLAAMCQGWGGKDLLASYQHERQPIARRNVELATRSFQSIQAIPNYMAGENTDVWAKQLRESLGRFVVTEFSKLQYCYEESPVCITDGTPPTEVDHLSYIPSARPGTRAPHFWLKDGRSVLDTFGLGFTLLQFGTETSVLGAEVIEAARSRSVPLKVVTVREPVAAALYQANLALIRPDGHVAWRGNADPENAMAIIDTVRGADCQLQGSIDSR